MTTPCPTGGLGARPPGAEKGCKLEKKLRLDPINPFYNPLFGERSDGGSAWGKPLCGLPRRNPPPSKGIGESLANGKSLGLIPTAVRPGVQCGDRAVNLNHKTQTCHSLSCHNSDHKHTAVHKRKCIEIYVKTNTMCITINTNTEPRVSAKA